MPSSDRSRGCFIVLDGIDGCGKSTQARRLVAALTRADAPEPLHLREPGSTAAGERIREVLLDRELELGAGTEALLLAAARREMLAERVAPAIAAGRDVVCERFHPATFAYQAIAGGLGSERVLGLLGEWCGAPVPDLEIVIDTPVEVAATRSGGPGDRIEDKGRDFQQRVAEGFRRYADASPRARRVDGSGSEEDVAAAILEEVRRVRC